MVQPSGILTLLTDFGTRDPFVGVMKGMILAAFPGARIVDLTHHVAPQDVMEAAFWLERSFRWFPGGTVHVAVVDPGVGTERRPVAVRAAGHLFVGPDNGLFAGVLASGSAEVRTIDLALAGPLSSTFHGRDLFGPVGARLAAGTLDFADVGPAAETVTASLRPAPLEADGRIVGVVVTVDHFGNLITNIEGSRVRALGDIVVRVGEVALRLVRTYGEAQPDEVVALVGAFDVLELARRDGSARTALGAAKGAAVTIEARRS